MSPLVSGITAVVVFGDRTHALYGGGFREESYLREGSPLTTMTNFPESL